MMKGISSTSKELKIGIVLSAIWLLPLMGLMFMAVLNAATFGMFILVGIAPLAVIWGYLVNIEKVGNRK